MKSSSLVVVAVAGAALAKPHVHQHQKRDRVVVYKNVVEQACRLSGAGGTVLRNLAYADCRAGLENGTYKAMGTGQFPFRGASTLITKTIIEVRFSRSTTVNGPMVDSLDPCAYHLFTLPIRADLTRRNRLQLQHQSKKARR
jgi:hypothetical protein